jgi:hypothetical protein
VNSDIVVSGIVLQRLKMVKAESIPGKALEVVCKWLSGISNFFHSSVDLEVFTPFLLQLHAADSPNPKLPIAQFQKTRWDVSTEPPTRYPAQLFLTARAKEIEELVIFTFLVLEKKRRSKETSEGSRADVASAGAKWGGGIGSVGA